MFDTYMPLIGVALVGVFLIVMWHLAEPKDKKSRKPKVEDRYYPKSSKNGQKQHVYLVPC